MVTVKTYPNPSTKYDETVCCAGITEDGNWVRLYPVRYRDLPFESQFKKYDVIEVIAERHNDNRPESWRPKIDSLKILRHIEPKDNWRERLEWIRPSLLAGYAELLRLQESEGKSLGAFRPMKVTDIKVTFKDDRWSAGQLAAINQLDLFSDKEPLELIPYRFHINFLDEKSVPHSLSVIDWEFCELWRKEHHRLKSREQAAEQVRKKLLEVTAPSRDLILFAGNQADPARRGTFLILGCFWPKIEPQMTLNF